MAKEFNKDSITNTIFVTLALCIICSVLVSTAAVMLKPVQAVNKELDMQKNILLAAGLIDSLDVSKAKVTELFKEATIKLVDLDTGEYNTTMDPATYDQRKASKDPNLSSALSASEDIASLKRRVKYAKVYLFEKDGKLDRLVLPIHGYGLWSTLYGFIALEADLKTVIGLGFYEHAETPGLGGEVDNPRWKQQWAQKIAFNDQGEAIIKLVKGGVDPGSSNANHEVDALAGATLTSRGVQHLLDFWLGKQGFGPFLANLRGDT